MEFRRIHVFPTLSLILQKALCLDSPNLVNFNRIKIIFPEMLHFHLNTTMATNSKYRTIFFTNSTCYNNGIQLGGESVRPSIESLRAKFEKKKKKKNVFFFSCKLYKRTEARWKYWIKILKYFRLWKRLHNIYPLDSKLSCRILFINLYYVHFIEQNVQKYHVGYTYIHIVPKYV